VKWTVHGERAIYESPWVRLALVDVELPSGHRIDHHVVRSTADATGTVVHVEGAGVLLLWRHRFITDTWGWEIPAGRIDSGESPGQAARRECLEESGWEPGALRLLTSYFPTNGLSDQVFHLFLADSAEYHGEPSDPDEAERVEWLPVPRLRSELVAGNVVDGLSLTALTWCLAHGRF
jgi:8-oxo-dGTP pyrophosphatase MutT (NUDIX family)